MTAPPGAMSALLLSILGLSAALHTCPGWKEIAPCSCRMNEQKLMTVTCEKMASFDQVVERLHGYFTPGDRVSMRIVASNLPDLSYRAFKELNMTIENLKLNHDYIPKPEADTFDGLTEVTYFSLADTNLGEVPENIWSKMPNIKTLDIGRANLKYVTESNFRDLSYLECLVLPGNQINRIDRNAIPRGVDRLHLGRNRIKHLNGTLQHLSKLTWLFLNTNEMTTVQGQLPDHAPNLKLVHLAENRLEQVPQQLRSYPALESLFFQKNALRSLDGALTRLKYLKRLVLEYNYINTITGDDFHGLENLEYLFIGYNEISTLNHSLPHLKRLNFLNITYNFLTEFSFQDIVGLEELKSIDASHNRISILLGPAANLVEWNIKLTELKLDHNLLETLNGALSNLPELLRLNLSYNKLNRISPDDFIGLDQLRLLDISHNHLTTLEETSKTFLPRLTELKASHNYLKVLERDFHGLPVLCHADLSNNQIVALGRDLVTKTRCKIEHGVHEGTWDTLKIVLQDNPILCDAALPEIVSAMEINHTRISGVSHCPPLSEQPVTKEPNAFLGYIPDSTPTTLFNQEPDNNLQPKLTYLSPAINLRPLEQYRLENDQPATGPDSNRPIVMSLQKNGTTATNQTAAFDPISQGQQITKLASEIEELRSRLDRLTTQNQLLLNKTLEQKGEETKIL